MCTVSLPTWQGVPTHRIAAAEIPTECCSWDRELAVFAGSRYSCGGTMPELSSGLLARIHTNGPLFATESAWTAVDICAEEGNTIQQLKGHSITYRIAMGPHAGRKVLILQTIPACEIHVSAVSEDSMTCEGIIGAGTRSGSRVALNGTSVATAHATRHRNGGSQVHGPFSDATASAYSRSRRVQRKG